MVMMHVWFIGLRGHIGDFAGKFLVRPRFLFPGFFLFVGILGLFFGGLILSHLWIGRAKHPGPASPGVEVFNVGGWLTHGDLALEVGVDFLAVVEHRLIPARVRSEWTRLRKKGLASIWAPANQDSSHVGNAGVGGISMKGAPHALPSFATAQFRSFFDSGRAVWCMLPLGSGRFMHLVVLYGYQGTDHDPEQLALTEQLFDAALSELSIVARGQPCLMVEFSDASPAHKITFVVWNDLHAHVCAVSSLTFLDTSNHPK